MNIDIICVGKIKEKYLNDAIAEYSKRLSRYCSLNILEVSDEKTVENASDSVNEKIKLAEGERIIKYIKKDALVVSLEIDGKMLSSIEMADKIAKWGVDGYSDIQFIIGGSIGLHDSIISRANYHMSFSKMTFPHQLMRVILLEQIYRSFRIINNEPYHK